MSEGEKNKIIYGDKVSVEEKGQMSAEEMEKVFKITENIKKIITVEKGSTSLYLEYEKELPSFLWWKINK